MGKSPYRRRPLAALPGTLRRKRSLFRLRFPDVEVGTPTRGATEANGNIPTTTCLDSDCDNGTNHQNVRHCTTEHEHHCNPHVFISPPSPSRSTTLPTEGSNPRDL